MELTFRTYDEAKNVYKACKELNQYLSSTFTSKIVGGSHYTRMTTESDGIVDAVMSVDETILQLLGEDTVVKYKTESIHDDHISLYVTITSGKDPVSIVQGIEKMVNQHLNKPIKKM